MTSPLSNQSSLPSSDDLWAVILKEQKDLDAKVIEEVKKMRGDDVSKTDNDDDSSNNSGVPSVSPDSSSQTEGTTGLFSLM